MFEFVNAKGTTCTVHCHGACMGKRKGRTGWDPYVLTETSTAGVVQFGGPSWVLGSILPDANQWREQAGLNLVGVALLSNSADTKVFEGCGGIEQKRFYKQAKKPPSMAELLQQLTDANETIADYSKAASAAKNLSKPGVATTKLNRLQARLTAADEALETAKQKNLDLQKSKREELSTLKQQKKAAKNRVGSHF